MTLLRIGKLDSETDGRCGVGSVFFELWQDPIWVPTSYVNNILALAVLGGSTVRSARPGGAPAGLPVTHRQ